MNFGGEEFNSERPFAKSEISSSEIHRIFPIVFGNSIMKIFATRLLSIIAIFTREKRNGIFIRLGKLLIYETNITKHKTYTLLNS